MSSENDDEELRKRCNSMYYPRVRFMNNCRHILLINVLAAFFYFAVRPCLAFLIAFKDTDVPNTGFGRVFFWDTVRIAGDIAECLAPENKILANFVYFVALSFGNLSGTAVFSRRTFLFAFLGWCMFSLSDSFLITWGAMLFLSECFHSGPLRYLWPAIDLPERAKSKGWWR